MMTQINFKILYGIIIFSLGLFVLPSYASDKPPSPLHIKLRDQKAEPNTVRIKKGRIPDVTQKDPMPLPIAEPKKETPDISPKTNEPTLIELQPCYKASPENENDAADLADALKLYLQNRQQSAELIDDIYFASQKTGVSFDLLVVKALIESNLGQSNISSSSTATGIYQFIEQTWLSLIKRYGERIGYHFYAEALDYNSKTKRYEVVDDSQFSGEDILNLRHDTRASALIKAYQIEDESALITKYKPNQKITATDYYIIHMLGLSLSKAFYELRQNESLIILADSKNEQFSEAIKLNRYFFFDKQNNGLTAGQAYDQFHQKIASSYQRLHTIYSQYGKGLERSHSCNTPKVQTISPQAQKAKQAQTEPNLKSLSSGFKTQKVKVYKD